MSLKSHWDIVIAAVNNAPRELRWFITMLACLFVVSIACLILFFPKVQHNTFKFEVAKTLLQLGVVAVIGGLVSLLMLEYQRNRQTFDKQQEEARKNAEKDRDIARDKAQYREDLLKSTLVKAMGAYSNVKKARRLLRARVIVREEQKEAVLGEQYDVYLEMVNDAQLELENLARDIRTSSPAFSDPRSLETTVWRMESYLGKLIGEYEDVRGNFRGQPPSLALAKLPFLTEFIGPSKDSKFRIEFSDPYHEIQRAIRADLLHPNLPAA